MVSTDDIRRIVGERAFSAGPGPLTAHRIAQDGPASVHRLITAATVEEKMEALKGRKRAVADRIVGLGAGSTLALGEGGLTVLFKVGARQSLLA